MIWRQLSLSTVAQALGDVRLWYDKAYRMDDCGERTSMRSLPSIREQLDASCAVIQSLAVQAELIERIAALARDTLLDGHMLLTCGNGGSATDAQHLAEELIGRYRANRRALPAVA